MRGWRKWSVDADFTFFGIHLEGADVDTKKFAQIGSDSFHTLDVGLVRAGVTVDAEHGLAGLLVLVCPQFTGVHCTRVVPRDQNVLGQDPADCLNPAGNLGSRILITQTCNSSLARSVGTQHDDAVVEHRSLVVGALTYEEHFQRSTRRDALEAVVRLDPRVLDRGDDGT